MTQRTLFDPPPNIARKSDPQTSQQSAAETEKKLGRYKAVFLQSLRHLKSATANEVAQDCVLLNGGVTESYRKRAKELLTDGLIEECGERRCEITGKNCRTFSTERKQMTNPLKWDYYQGSWDACSEIKEDGISYLWSINVLEDGTFDTNESHIELRNSKVKVSSFKTLEEAKQHCQAAEDEIVADAATAARAEAKYGKEWCNEPGC
jgi:hypothetical protein